MKKFCAKKITGAIILNSQRFLKFYCVIIIESSLKRLFLLKICSGCSGIMQGTSIEVVKANAVELVKTLSEGELLAVDDQGKTTLHWAVSRVQLPVVTIILEKVGPKLINAIDSKGNTPLMTCCKWNNDSVSVRNFLPK